LNLKGRRQRQRTPITRLNIKNIISSRVFFLGGKKKGKWVFRVQLKHRTLKRKNNTRNKVKKGNYALKK